MVLRVDPPSDRNQDAHQAMLSPHLSLLDIIGGSLRAEIESFIQRDQERPISLEYLSTLGRVKLDQRKSLLYEARLEFDDSIRRDGEDRRLSFMLVYAAFGPLLTSNVIRAGLVLPSDEFGESPLGDHSGRVILLKRGKVPFAIKAQRAQMAGAAAVIIVQTFDMWPFVMTDSSTEGLPITIPVLMISSPDGELVEKILRERRIAPISLKLKDVNDECSICQESMKEGESILKLPGCGHAYHDSCVLSWLEKQHTCPLCRNAMPKRDTTGNSRTTSTLNGHMSYYYN